MPIDVTITREDGDHSQFITGFKFPTEPDTLRQKLEQLGLTTDNIDQFSITDIDFSHDEYTAEIENRFPESINLIAIDKLNHLAVLLDGLSNDDQLKAFTLFDYAAEMNEFPYECDGLDDMIDLIDNMHRFTFVEDVDDIYDFSSYLIDNFPLPPSAVQQMEEGTFDAVEYAKEYMDKAAGTFVHWGYMDWCGEYEPAFVDRGVPDVNRVWEQAIAGLVAEPFIYPEPAMDIAAINNGEVEIPSLQYAHEICGLAWGGQDPELFGGEGEKATQIIEMAHMLQTDPASFPEWLNAAILPRLGADTVAHINRLLKDYEDGAMDVQIEYEVAPSVVEPHSAMLPKLLADYSKELHDDSLLCALLVARELHRQKIDQLSPAAERVFMEDASEAQRKAFHLLPSDKQVMLEVRGVTDHLALTLALDHSKKMVEIYNGSLHMVYGKHKLPPKRESVLGQLKQAQDAVKQLPEPKQGDKRPTHEL